MIVIIANDVDSALRGGLRVLLNHGEHETSRNGPVLVASAPVCTVYNHPRRHVLLNAVRDANPFFHFMEALWMLAGRNDVVWPAYFNSRIHQFSDNGLQFWGAYGYRWRRWFGYDQLELIVKELRANPNSRRAVLAMWDAEHGSTHNCGDLHRADKGGKDVPCNTHAYFDCRGGALNMTVCQRSGDVLWGVYGANVVHMSIMMEYVAAWIGVPVGAYRQITNNFHCYTDVFSEEKLLAMSEEKTENVYSIYADEFPLITLDGDDGARSWDSELSLFMSDPTAAIKYKNALFADVAQPMYMAWKERKEKRGHGMGYVSQIAARDWRKACAGWIVRRENKEAVKA